MSKFENKVALVTGAAKGIGKAIAQRLLNDGAQGVALVDYDKALLEQTARELDANRCIAIACDVANYEQVQSAVVQALNHFGKVDILVNNAGITRDKIFHKMDEDAWNKVLEVNLNGPFYFCRQLIPYMREQGYGRIVNISSLSAFGNIGQANYSASKAGLIGFTKTIAKENGAKNITANCVAPGSIDTDMFAAVPEETKAGFIKSIPMGRMGKPEEVASVVAFLASDDAGFVTGECLKVCGGMPS